MSERRMKMKTEANSRQVSQEKNESTHSENVAFNLDYRPTSYWGAEPHRPYRGTTRDDIAHDLGEEFLPDYEDDEVEIARVELQSTTGDVLSVRAHRGQKFITYSVVDEYEARYKFRPRRSKLPLTMGQLINLLDGAQENGSDYKGLATAAIQWALDEGEEPEDYLEFVTVSSHFYPELERYYGERIRGWLTEVKRGRASQDKSKPEADDNSAPRHNDLAQELLMTRLIHLPMPMAPDED